MIHEDLHRADSSLARLVVEALARDPRLSSQPIEVRTEPRTLRLRGTVQSHRRKLDAQRAVEELVERVTGSVEVRNELEVATATRWSDAGIAEAARRAVEEHDELAKTSIVVASRAGRVTLSGTVASERERTLAEDVVLGVEGVREVTNLLVANPDARRLDAERGAAVQELFATTPELAREDLRAAVVEDSVLISGRVRSESLRRLAVRLVEQRFDGIVRDDVQVVA